MGPCLVKNGPFRMFSEPTFSFIAPTGKTDTKGPLENLSTAVDKLFIAVFSGVYGVLNWGIYTP